MRFVGFLSVALTAGLLLSGCGTIRGTLNGVGLDNSPPPSPLVKCRSQIPVKGVWMVSAGRSIGSDCLKLGPELADNMIFTADPKGGVLASNPRNGKRIWWVNTKAKITSGPTVGEGIVVVGTGDGKVIALRENNGAPLWHADVPNAVLAAPQIGQGRVIVKTVDGKLIALSVQSGQQLWIYDHGAPMLVLRSADAPQIYGNKVIAGFSDGKLAAFSLSQGQLLWEQSVATPQGVSQVEQLVDMATDPLIANGVVYIVSYQGGVTALAANSGQILWQQDLSCSGYAGAVLSPRSLFITDSQDQIWAFDRQSGDLIWQQNQLAYRHLSAPTLLGGTLVVGDAEGYLHWLSQQDGHYLARRLAEGHVKILAAPAVAGNIMYVASANGNLSAWRVG